MNELLASASTDAQGEFRFHPKIAIDGVVSQFFLEFEIPVFAAFTTPDVGADDAVDSDADAVLGTTATFEINSAGQKRLDIDAGLINGFPVIGDRVWHDANSDGVQQLEEKGVASVVVRLLDAVGNELASATTNSQGLFVFAGVAAGTYMIEVDLPAGSEFSAQDVGVDDAIDSDVEPLTGRSASFAYTLDTLDTIDRSRDVGLAFPPLFADGFESGNTSAWTSGQL